MPHLYYIHDPMCSWCWGFRPALEELLRRLPDGIGFSRLLGGLAPDTDQPMPEEMRLQLQATWRHIQERIPQTRFNFDFWNRNTPRRATYPACRAVIAARALSAESEDRMILAIQQAYYLQARNPSDDETLIALAAEIGLDAKTFADRLHAPDTRQRLEQEIAGVHAMGVHSFPSLVYEDDNSRWPVAIDYRSADTMLETLQLVRS
ncbi:MAG: DsbA family protein [Candidatus Thiodiazotropha sp.]